MNIYFEGVCVTAVIPAPGACGMGGPSRGSCHHFPGSRGSRGEFQKRRSCCYTRYLRARDLPPKFDFEQPSVTFGTQGLILNNPPSILKDDPWGSQILAFWEKKGPCGHAKTNSWLWFSKKVIVWISQKHDFWGFWGPYGSIWADTLCKWIVYQ